MMQTATRLTIDEERRAGPRAPLSIPAVCKVGLVRYRVHISDVGARGLTVLAPPLLPRNPIYVIVCRTPDRGPVRLVVREVHRILVSRRKSFLRLGLRVIEGDLDNLRAARMIPASGKEPEPRGLVPIHFSLPACARLSGHHHLCRTVDMSNGWLSIVVADDFPEVGVFDLWFTDPSGGEIPLLVQEERRTVNPDNPRELRLGLWVIGGAKAFRQFLSRHLPDGGD